MHCDSVNFCPHWHQRIWIQHKNVINDDNDNYLHSCEASHTFSQRQWQKRRRRPIQKLFNFGFFILKRPMSPSLITCSCAFIAVLRCNVWLLHLLIYSTYFISAMSKYQPDWCCFFSFATIFYFVYYSNYYYYCCCEPKIFHLVHPRRSMVMRNEQVNWFGV